MLSPLKFFLKRLVRVGRLTLVDHRGRRTVFEGSQDGPSATIRLHDAKVAWQIARNPRLGVGEAYMDGRLTIEDGTLRDFLELVTMNVELFDEESRGGLLDRLSDFLTNLQHYNPVGKAQKNVAHHYDLSDELFDHFLCSDRQYSCAYFVSPDDDIETAQLQKKRHIAAKLLLEPGQEVLDIGCGWGGLALYLAKLADVRVTGLTLSKEQHAVATRRAKAAGLADRVTFRLQDYRLEEATYNRIVSVGMFEHVGNLHYDEFFAKLKQLLKPDGVALLHTIGRADKPAPINPWMRKYIFPGAYLPSLGQLAPRIDKLGMWLTDFESLRLHYAETLRLWDEAFQKNRAHIARLYDERFCRMWEMYLQGCEAGFRHNRLTVFQMQIARSIDAVPTTRDYMLDFERENPLAAPVAPPRDTAVAAE